MPPIFQLLSEFDRASVAGELLSVKTHDNITGAIVYTYSIKHGTALLVTMNNILHEVTYQTPMRMPWSKKKRNRHLFKHYSPNGDWVEQTDNGLAKFYLSESAKAYSQWSYKWDFNTFGTMVFYEVLGF